MVEVGYPRGGRFATSSEPPIHNMAYISHYIYLTIDNYIVICYYLIINSTYTFSSSNTALIQ